MALMTPFSTDGMNCAGNAAAPDLVHELEAFARRRAAPAAGRRGRTGRGRRVCFTCLYWPSIAAVAVSR